MKGLLSQRKENEESKKHGGDKHGNPAMDGSTVSDRWTQDKTCCCGPYDPRIYPRALLASIDWELTTCSDRAKHKLDSESETQEEKRSLPQAPAQ